jgi:hypothetical protein
VAAIAGSQALAGAPLVVDQTGVGRPVVDMLRRTTGWVVPITITGGQAVTQAPDGSYHVPKKELVTCLQVVLQSRRMQITATAHETFGAWRQGQHDDLVLAVALACWWAERNPPRGPEAFSGGGRSLIADAPEGVFLSGASRSGTSSGWTWGRLRTARPGRYWRSRAAEAGRTMRCATCTAGLRAG